MRAPHIKHSAKHALLVNMLDAKKSLFDNDGNPRPALTNALDSEADIEMLKNTSDPQAVLDILSR